jgi:hypothetical protein
METPNKSNFHQYQILSPSVASPQQQNSWLPNPEESPSSSDESQRFQENLNRSFDGQNGSKRGRPKSELLTTLMIQGSTSPSAIKCKFCNRVFPRDKSLSAHLRTHTGNFLSIFQRGYKNLIINFSRTFKNVDDFAYLDVKIELELAGLKWFEEKFCKMR